MAGERWHNAQNLADWQGWHNDFVALKPSQAQPTPIKTLLANSATIFLLGLPLLISVITLTINLSKNPI